MSDFGRKPAPRRRDRSGLSLLYVVLFFIILIAFVGFGVDLGRMRLARAQLQTAADASARAGASALRIGAQTVKDRAVAIAAENNCLNVPVDLDPELDVDFGLWDTTDRTFTLVTDDPGTAADERLSANAVRTYARRIDDRDNPIQLYFAAILGFHTNNIETPAVAMIRGGQRGWGFVGLDFVRMTGTTMTDSYNAAEGPYDPDTAGDNGSVASNGDITANGTVDINGDAHPGPGHIVDTTSNNVTITGDTTPLEEPLAFEGDAAPSSTNNSSIPSSVLKNDGFDLGAKKSFTFNEGVYYFKSFKVNGTATLNVNGDVEIYVDGNVDMGGSVKVNTDHSNFYLSVIKANTTVDLKGVSATHTHIYSPLSDVKVNGTPGFFGYIIGKSLTFLGTSNLHYDESLPDDSGPPQITLVK